MKFPWSKPEHVHAWKPIHTQYVPGKDWPSIVDMGLIATTVEKVYENVILREYVSGFTHVYYQCSCGEYKRESFYGHFQIPGIEEFVGSEIRIDPDPNGPYLTTEEDPEEDS